MRRGLTAGGLAGVEAVARVTGVRIGPDRTAPPRRAVERMRVRVRVRIARIR